MWVGVVVGCVACGCGNRGVASEYNRSLFVLFFVCCADKEDESNMKVTNNIKWSNYSHWISAVGNKDSSG